MKTKLMLCLTAHNSAKTLEKTIKEAPIELFDEIVVVDDGSVDETSKIVRRLNLSLLKHSRNQGYGAAQKTLYDYAVKKRADVVVLLHADNQYTPSKIKDLILPIIKDQADFVFGSRFAYSQNPLKGGMPLGRFVAIKIVTHIENSLLKTNFSELHSGFKAYNRIFLESIDYKNYPNDFSFDSEMLFDCIVKKSFRLKEIPIPTRFNNLTSSMTLKDAIIYVPKTFKLLIEKIIQNEYY